MSTPKLTAEQQYYDLKAKYPDCILFFRIGDFYEVFDDDAREMSKVLGLTLTSRDKSEKKRAMAGVPHHALNQYLGKAVKLGYKIAIAEQMEDPKLVKGIVKRDVTKVVTAGTLIDEKNLQQEQSNYILALNYTKSKNSITWGISYLELSTGEFKLIEFETKTDYLSQNKLPSKVIDKISLLQPKEILIPEKLKYFLAPIIQTRITLIEEFQFDFDINYKKLTQHFKTQNLSGFGIGNYQVAIGNSGVILSYVETSERTELTHISKLTYDNLSETMNLDFATIRSLELLEPINISNLNYDKPTTLLSVLDKTKTPMGKRLIRNWIIRPLINLEKIELRADNVEIFTKLDDLNQLSISEILNNIFDIERITGRIGLRTISPKDFIALSDSIEEIVKLVNIQSNLNFFENTKINLDKFILKKLDQYLNSLQQIKTKIQESLLANPSFEINQGGIFNSNYNSEIAELRNMSTNSKDWILNYQAEQISKTQITNLKVKFNSVFGYFIEVSNSQVAKVPENYIRKQTIAGGERYITQELKEMEQKILTADDRLINLEKELYLSFREEFVQYIQTLQQVSQIIAEVDVLFSYSEVAKLNNYVRAKFNSNSQVLNITSSRHPVVEKLVENFTSNDLSLDQKNSMIVLTGPNMSGKSTYIRQVALIVIMAQIGSFVPAESCELSLVDRVFTRVGASDNLSKGESTFMVEMNETANILNNATVNSLLILDEIGRGTSTFDGVAIAWSVMKYIYENLKCRTLFATHYLELTELEKKYEGISNFSVQIAEKNDQVIFMHKIIQGRAQKSFGVHVAEIAGMPNEVINSAKEILKSFEESQNKVKKVVNNKLNSNSEVPQMGLFDLNSKLRRDDYVKVSE